MEVTKHTKVQSYCYFSSNQSTMARARNAPDNFCHNRSSYFRQGKHHLFCNLVLENNKHGKLEFGGLEVRSKLRTKHRCDSL